MVEPRRGGGREKRLEIERERGVQKYKLYPSWFVAVQSALCIALVTL